MADNLPNVQKGEQEALKVKKWQKILSSATNPYSNNVTKADNANCYPREIFKILILLYQIF